MVEEHNNNAASLAEIEKRRKGRNLAVGLSLAGFVLLIFVITLVRLGPGVLDRPL